MNLLPSRDKSERVFRTVPDVVEEPTVDPKTAIESLNSLFSSFQGTATKPDPDGKACGCWLCSLRPWILPLALVLLAYFIAKKFFK